MKTVIVSFYEAYPPISGAATVTYNMTKFLSGEKYLIQLSDDKRNKKIDGNINLINIRHISNNRLIKAVNLALQFPIIIKKIKQINPEVIILEGASWALYYLILFYLLKINRIKAKVIYHAHNVEYLLRKQKNNRIIAMITKWAEGNIMKKSGLSTAVSEVDALNFKRLYRIKPFILPNGVDVERFERVNDDQINKIKTKYNLNGKVILFMGLTSFKPNKEAIDFLINDVFPNVIKECPDAKLAVIGGDIKYKNKWLINPGIIPFEEIPIFIQACDVCVAPIFSGSGTRLKILEYMAAGKPVVSTTKGAEGIIVEDGENIILADDEKSFTVKITCLLENQKLTVKIGNQGKALVGANYSWQKIVQDFNEKILCLLG